jgi:hypothetical protein
MSKGSISKKNPTPEKGVRKMRKKKILTLMNPLLPPLDGRNFSCCRKDS